MNLKEILDATKPFWGRILASVIYILVAALLYSIVSRIIKKFFGKSRRRLNAHQAQRMNTIQSMMLSAAKYVAIIGTILAILATFGLNVSSILAGLGIMTVLLGLALQDLAKDVIAGFTIIAESQYEVGDVIEVNGFRGTVTSVGLKSTRVENYKGDELIISNSNMTQMINYSTNNSLAEVTFTVSRDVDPEKVESALKSVMDNLKSRKIPELLGEINYLGPVDLDKNTSSWQMTADGAPTENQTIERALRKEIQTELKKAKIASPAKLVEIVK